MSRPILDELVTRVVVVKVANGFVYCRSRTGEIWPVAEDLVDGEPLEMAVGDLDEVGLLFLLDPATFALPCAVVACRPADPHLRLVHDSLPGRQLELPIAEFGLADYREAQQVQRSLRYLVLDRTAHPPGFWDHDGGLDGWRADQVAQRQVAEADWIRARTPEEWQGYFVNPYTFVPFPKGDDVCPRHAPVGHAQLLAGCLAGWIDVTWEAITPILVRGEDRGDIARFPTRTVAGTTRLLIPGSSVKGSLRSLHEAMAGGCLRVLDVDFLPAYRDHAAIRGRTWTLARVDQVDPHDGRPISLTLCDPVVWAKATDLHGAVGGSYLGLRTGSTVDVNPDPRYVVKDGRTGRWELVDAAGLTAGTSWVVLVTDEKARNTRHPYWCATGRLAGITAEVTRLAWDRYQAAVAGSRDVQEGAGGFALVEFDGVNIGCRSTAERHMKLGEVIWVRQSAPGQVDEVALSALWRHAGEIPMGERVPEQLLPCHSAGELCVSCRLFGAADSAADERSGGEARQDSYRGHVRFGDAVGGDSATLAPEPIELPPLGAPRPGAGQFYLDHRGNVDPARRREDRPSREWGAAPDVPEPRMLRGRKFYWHGDPALQTPPRHTARRGQSASLSKHAEVAVAGSAFSARLWFENLTPAELGGLVAAVDPSGLLTRSAPPGWAAPALAGHLGGGKPLGLGSVRVLTLDLTVHSAATRYGGMEAKPPPNIDDLMAEFEHAVPSSVRATWPDLAAVLSVGHVNPKVIWYPPGAAWDRAGADEFDEGFEFWKKSAGRYLHPDNEQEPLISIPDPRHANQYLPIVPGGRPRP